MSCSKGWLQQTAKKASGWSLDCCGVLSDPCLTQGFLWRDCKPENILLGGPDFSSVKLADFGLSIDSTEERPVTRAGTLDYMAPEVVHGASMCHSHVILRINCTMCRKCSTKAFDQISLLVCHDGQVVMCPEKSYPQENKEKALLGYTSR